MRTTDKMKADSTMPNLNGWQDRHNKAVDVPFPGFEWAIQRMLAGWIEYANVHQTTYDSPIGDDGVLGDHWQAIGAALHGLLDGQTGRFDAGTFSSLIQRTAKENNAPLPE